MTVIGIDAGNDQCTVGFFRYHGLEILTNGRGNKQTPSVICFDKSRVLVGESAIELAPRNLKNFIFDIKEMLGQKFDDPQFQAIRGKWPFDVEASEDGGVQVVITMNNEKKCYPAYELWGIILKHMADFANSRLDKPTNQVVLTIPGYFSETQREDTMRAARSAELDVIELLTDPNAASVAYGFTKKVMGEDTSSTDLLVVDIGAHNVSVTYLECKDGSFEPLATSRDSSFGASTVTDRLVDFVSQSFETQHQVDFKKSPKSMFKLRQACEKAKRTLSQDTVAEVVMEDTELDREIEVAVTRDQLEAMCKDFVGEIYSLIDGLMGQAGKQLSGAYEVLALGGASKMPVFCALLESMTGRAIYSGFDAQEATAIGASISGAKGRGAETIEDLKKITASEGNTEQVPCLGVAADIPEQASSPSVCPASIAIGLNDDSVMRLIQRGAHMPATRTLEFPLGYPTHTQMTLTLYAGESMKASENRHLGDVIADIPQVPDCPHLMLEVRVTMVSPHEVQLTHRVVTAWSVPHLMPVTEERAQKMQQEETANNYLQRLMQSQPDPTIKKLVKSETKKRSKKELYIIQEMKRLRDCLTQNGLDPAVVGYVTCRIEMAERGEAEFTDKRSKFAKETFKKALSEIRKGSPHFGHPEWFKFVPYHK